MVRYAAGVALLFIAVGCAGRASVAGDGVAGASPVEPSAGAPGTAGAPPLDPGAGAPGSAGARPQIEPGEGGRPGAAGAPPHTDPGDAGAPPTATDCKGSVEELNALTDAQCPSTWCAAQAWATDCNHLPASVREAVPAKCSGWLRIDLELTSGVGKTCYYKNNLGSGRDPVLTAVQLWSPAPSYCQGTATYVESSSVASTSCVADLNVRCTGTDRLPSAPSPAQCFDAFSNSCGNCCPSDPVDCTTHPDGFPAGGCVAKENSFCSCSCQSSEWSCAC